MMLVTRDGKTLWNDESRLLPGKIYSQYINDVIYEQEKFNDPELALDTSVRELGELLNNHNEQEYLYSIILPSLSSSTSIRGK